MLIRIAAHIADYFLHRQHSPAYLAPIQKSNAATTIRNIFDGLMLACPKHRTPIRKILSRRYGGDNWKYGQKLFKSKRNIVTCLECGDFHEIHTICRSCYKKVEEESKKIIQGIKGAWGKNVIDKEVQILYHGETVPTSDQKRVVELERPRPMWFVPNLSQKSVNLTKTIGGPAAEADNLTVKVKDSSNS